MHPNMFGYPVEVSKHEDGEWPFDTKFDQIEILQCLNAFFGHPDMHSNIFQFYEVNRPGYGIDRGVTVLINQQNEYYAIRIFTKPGIISNKVPFDPAAYIKDRIQQLYMALRDHYPATYFLNTKHLLIILQQFVFFPVCQFINPSEIRDLLEIMWYASKARILLDYNQNHWLVSDDGHLLYVDTDFMGQILKDRYSALSENFNQAMVFINHKNCNILAKILPEFATRGNNYAQFLDEFFLVLKNYLESWEKVEIISEKVQSKLDCFQNIFDKYWAR